MSSMILGKKLGMSQVFDDKGKFIPVTILQAGPCVVVRRKTKEKDGYTASQLGFESCLEKNTSKPKMGYFKKAGITPVRLIKETKSDLADGTVEIKVDIFKEGEYVDITGTSKGKGFAGGMKRWNWKGGGAAHGSMHHRRVGSIGNRATPGRVFKGKHMPGRMGNDTVTVQGLKVVKIDKDRNIMLVKGAVPGVREGYLVIKKAVKVKK
jgi:large subunit ribosomal protein L3